MMRHLVKRLPAVAVLLVLAGCPAAPRLGPSETQTALQTQTNARAVAAPGLQDADPVGGRIANVQLGMTADAAIAAAGKPDVSYPDLLTWHGGHLAATLVNGHVVALRTNDRAVSIGGVRLGDPLTTVQTAFPGGTLHTESEVLYFVLPDGHSYLELGPSSRHEVTGFRIGAPAPHRDGVGS